MGEQRRWVLSERGKVESTETLGTYACLLPPLLSLTDARTARTPKLSGLKKCYCYRASPRCGSGIWTGHRGNLDGDCSQGKGRPRPRGQPWKKRCQQQGRVIKDSGKVVPTFKFLITACRCKHWARRAARKEEASTQWTDALALRGLSRAAVGGTWGTSLVHGVPWSWSQLSGTQHSQREWLISAPGCPWLQMTPTAVSWNPQRVAWRVSLSLLSLSTWHLGSVSPNELSHTRWLKAPRP